MEKRKHQRMIIQSLSVDVADGNGFFSGRVCDISRMGLFMTDLPRDLNEKEEILTVLISGERQNFKMNVMPKWHIQGVATISVGVEIVIIPRIWAEFVKSLEPEMQKDVWAKSTMKKAWKAVISGMHFNNKPLVHPRKN
jgi:hypothetical protein